MAGKKAEANKDEAKAEGEPKSLFVISPIGVAGSNERKHADLVFNYIIKPIAAEFGYDAMRGDHYDDPGIITDHIVHTVVDAEICIVDFSFLNANVFYELGLRHYVAKPVIHIASIGTDIPFDNRGVRTVFYDLSDWESHEQARSGVRGAIAQIHSPGFEVSNPVTNALAVREVKRSPHPESQVLSDLAVRVEELEKHNVKAHRFQPSPSSRKVKVSIMGVGSERHLKLVEIATSIPFTGVGCDELARRYEAIGFSNVSQDILSVFKRGELLRVNIEATGFSITKVS